MKSEKENLEYQQEESRKIILELEKKERKSQIEMDTLRRQNEYKVYVADSVEKDKRILEQEKQEISTQLENLRSINSIVETLAKVENKALWANSIKRTQPIDEQAKVFFESYRIQLTKEEEMKEKIERLR